MATRRQWRHLDLCQYKTILQADVAQMNGVFDSGSVQDSEDQLRCGGSDQAARGRPWVCPPGHATAEAAVHRREGGRRGHQYVTVVSCAATTPARVVAVEDGREEASLDRFGRSLTKAQRTEVKTVAMGRRTATRWHDVANHMNRALDKVRRGENVYLLASGDTPLKGFPWRSPFWPRLIREKRRAWRGRRVNQRHGFPRGGGLL